MNRENPLRWLVHRHRPDLPLRILFGSCASRRSQRRQHPRSRHGNIHAAATGKHNTAKGHIWATAKAFYGEMRGSPQELIRARCGDPKTVVLRLDRTGKNVKRFYGVGEAAKSVNGEPMCIVHACSGHYTCSLNTYKGYIWRYDTADGRSLRKHGGVPIGFRKRCQEDARRQVAFALCGHQQSGPSQRYLAWLSLEVGVRHKISVGSGDGWVAVYLDGKRISEGHKPSLTKLAEALDCDYETFEAESFPEDLDEVERL